MAFALLQARPAEGYTVVEGYVGSNFSRLADHNAHTMVNKKSGTDGCAGMYLDPGNIADNLRGPATE